MINWYFSQYSTTIPMCMAVKIVNKNCFSSAIALIKIGKQGHNHCPLSTTSSTKVHQWPPVKVSVQTGESPCKLLPSTHCYCPCRPHKVPEVQHACGVQKKKLYMWQLRCTCRKSLNAPCHQMTGSLCKWSIEVTLTPYERSRLMNLAFLQIFGRLFGKLMR